MGTEERLAESERRFRLLIESIPHHVWSFRTDGLLLYWNRRLVDYTGLTAEEMRGGGWEALHPGDGNASRLHGRWLGRTEQTTRWNSAYVGAMVAIVALSVAQFQ
jgi:PAS domain S-box-containing protein